MESHMLKILLPISAALMIASALATVYWTTITHTGNIVAYGCKVYLDDKMTESYSVSWGDIAVSGVTIQYRWIYNNATGTNIKWSHDSPTYVQLTTYYEQPTGTWNLWNSGTTLGLSQGQWLHVKFELTALPDSVNHLGTFQFKVYIELS